MQNTASVCGSTVFSGERFLKDGGRGCCNCGSHGEFSGMPVCSREEVITPWNPWSGFPSQLRCIAKLDRQHDPAIRHKHACASCGALGDNFEASHAVLEIHCQHAASIVSALIYSSQLTPLHRSSRRPAKCCRVGKSSYLHACAVMCVHAYIHLPACRRMGGEICQCVET